MRNHQHFTPSDFALLLAICCFFLGSVGYVWTPGPWPWNGRLISFGLFCWSLSTVIP